MSVRRFFRPCIFAYATKLRAVLSKKWTYNTCMNAQTMAVLLLLQLLPRKQHSFIIITSFCEHTTTPNSENVGDCCPSPSLVDAPDLCKMSANEIGSHFRWRSAFDFAGGDISVAFA